MLLLMGAMNTVNEFSGMAGYGIDNNFNSNSTPEFTQIDRDVQSAREYALLGKYDQASIFYEGVIKLIQKYVQSCPDPRTRDRWILMRQNLSVEYQNVKNIIRILDSMKLDGGNSYQKPLANRKISDGYEDRGAGKLPANKPNTVEIASKAKF